MRSVKADGRSGGLHLWRLTQRTSPLRTLASYRSGGLQRGIRPVRQAIRRVRLRRGARGSEHRPDRPLSPLQGKEYTVIGVARHSETEEELASPQGIRRPRAVGAALGHVPGERRGERAGGAQVPVPRAKMKGSNVATTLKPSSTISRTTASPRQTECDSSNYARFCEDEPDQLKTGISTASGRCMAGRFSPWPTLPSERR